MFPPAIVYILIQLVGLYGAFRLGSEGVSCDSKGRKKSSFDPKRMFKNEPINSWMVIAFLAISVLIALTNVSSFVGFGGGGYSGGYGGMY